MKNAATSHNYDPRRPTENGWCNIVTFLDKVETFKPLHDWH